MQITKNTKVGHRPCARRTGLLVALVIAPLLMLFALLASLTEASVGRTSVALLAPSSVIAVTTTADERNSDGDCSLREAIQAANTDAPVDACPAGAGADTIILPAGTYTLAIPGRDEDANARGDLDVLDVLALSGHDQSDTIIDGQALDRIFDIRGTVVSIEGVTIRNGRLGTRVYEEGGGLRVTGGVLTMIRSTVVGNVSESRGGGLINSGFIDSALTLIDCTIRGNEAGGEWQGLGGGIYNGGTLTLRNSLVVDNRASVDSGGYGGSYGGGIANGNGLVLIEGSSILSNSAIYAGGLDNDFLGVMTVTNSTVSGNDQGISSGGRLVLKNVTIAHNGLGLSASRYTASANVLIAHNFEDCEIQPDTEWVTLSPNLDSDGSCPAFDTGPALLGPLADNGGPTLTHLPAGMDIVDAGGNLACPATDQRGVVRPQDGHGDGYAVCDIGAVEAWEPLPLIGLTLAGPAFGDICTDYVFTVIVSPLAATRPITYLWQATDQPTVSRAGEAIETVNLLWEQAGDKNVSVEAANVHGGVLANHELTIDDLAGELPIARLTALSDGPTTLSSTTTLTATYACGTNATLAWDFGDGTAGTGAVVTHTYETAGAYRATVTATNSAGTTAAQTTVVVQEAVDGLTASCETPVFKGQPTMCSAAVRAGTEAAFSWAHGDGSQGSGATVEHTYWIAGIYTVTATAYNAVSTVSTTTRVVAISPPTSVERVAFAGQQGYGGTAVAIAALLLASGVLGLAARMRSAECRVRIRWRGSPEDGV